MKVEVLISCMNQKNAKIVEKTNVQSDALVINQCDQIDQNETIYNGHRIRMISTNEHGLSRSRNMAIANCTGDIGLICDDDEYLFNNYQEIILDAYNHLPDADIIAFRFANQKNRLKQSEQRLNKWTVLRISSWQISFRTDSIRKKNLKFDEYMGAGSGNGASEEVKFLRDCIKAGLKIWYVPEDIGTVANDYYETGKGDQSIWFNGFDQHFFYQRGMVNRYMLGFFPAVAYSFYYAIAKKKMYRQYISPFKALEYTLKGVINNDIVKQKRRDKKI